MMTDFTIASDPRYKVAMAGAGIGNELGMYGSDQYIRQYNNEIGPPWKNLDTWIKISYPFYHADRIKTPTLFMVGRSDFNVPLVGTEQMYQSLRTLGIPTQLVIYPDQFHIFTRPELHPRSHGTLPRLVGQISEVVKLVCVASDKQIAKRPDRRSENANGRASR